MIMRCPYCGGSNTDQTIYCTRCGRDMRKTTTIPEQQYTQRPPAPRQPTPPPYPQRPTIPQQPTPPPQKNLYPPNPSINPKNPFPATQPGRPAATANTTQTRPQKQPSVQHSPVAPTGNIQQAAATQHTPAGFPPKKMDQLAKLVQEAKPFTIIDNSVNNKKKIIRIAYPACSSWQQVGTLFKALKDSDDRKYDTIIVQGVFNPGDSSLYYTNGQLTFDRNVRLGSEIQNRYQIETGNGYANDSIRFVLSE